MNVEDSTSLSVAASVSDSGTLSYSNTTNSTSEGTAITEAMNETYAPPAGTAGTTYYYVYKFTLVFRHLDRFFIFMKSIENNRLF
ncbi:hypothetical protein [Aneurinibacillus uraniidurans]|uniref:hypothetical protein n=1 Tax=Aneurinibacillus uraniidurans TaxID=2966586 RepID=UPI00234B8B23|nr:hypothetical protein [Aneurinibacillus sp. B1]WCN38339.1 hypothetical protein PO771_02780 [Aneurinibacillus sp. B1]